MRLPPRPDLHWGPEGVPEATEIGDVYFSRQDGLAESRVVFLQACGLPERFSQNVSFTVAELGFGTGLNFLALWQVWQKFLQDKGLVAPDALSVATNAHSVTARSRSSTAQIHLGTPLSPNSEKSIPQPWLHFVSFESSPLEPQDIRKALAPWPELIPYREALLSRWPLRAKGVQCLNFPAARLSLILHIGDIAETLPLSCLQADAWFLDGFSPSRNPTMWGGDLWPQIAARSRFGARIGTFTVAGDVRRGLSAAGFEVTRAPGFGQKRERLEAVFKPQNGSCTTKSIPQNHCPKIAIIGAGIAGAWLAYTLHSRGAEVCVYEAYPTPASGASGNPLALLMPRLDAGLSPAARVHLSAYVCAVLSYRDWPGAETVAAVQRPKDATEAARFAKLMADPPLGIEALQSLENGELIHKNALIIRPKILISNLLDGIEVQYGTTAHCNYSEKTVNGVGYDAIILATGHHMCGEFEGLGLVPKLGQVDWLEGQAPHPPSALASGHYALASGDVRLWGASFTPVSPGEMPPPDAKTSLENRAALEALAPSWLKDLAPAPPQSRTSIRATSADRLPLIGPLPDIQSAREKFAKLKNGVKIQGEMPVHEGVYLISGLGARGFTFAPWAAQLIRAMIFTDPLPLEQDILQILSPARQILRDLKRNNIPKDQV